MKPRIVACVVIAVVLGGLLGACGSQSSAPSQSNAALCSAEGNLKASISALVHTNVVSSGKSGITSAVSQIQGDLTAVKSAAKGTVSPQVATLKSSINALAATVQGLTTSNLVATIPTITSEISQVGSAAASLYSSLKPTCG